MLRSSTQLAKSHGDDLGLEYLWNGDEYSSLKNCFTAIETNSEHRGQQYVLAGDDLGLEYLWNGDEYGSLKNCFKAIETNSEYRGQQEVLALERPIAVHYETQTKALFLEKFY